MEITYVVSPVWHSGDYPDFDWSYVRIRCGVHERKDGERECFPWTRLTREFDIETLGMDGVE